MLKRNNKKFKIKSFTRKRSFYFTESRIYSWKKWELTRELREGSPMLCRQMWQGKSVPVRRQTKYVFLTWSPLSIFEKEQEMTETGEEFGFPSKTNLLGRYGMGFLLCWSTEQAQDHLAPSEHSLCLNLVTFSWKRATAMKAIWTVKSVQIVSSSKDH